MAGGHLTYPPKAIIYSSVILLDTVIIILINGALNYFDTNFFDIGNSYLNADTDDKLYFISIKKFVPEDEGATTMVVKA